MQADVSLPVELPVSNTDLIVAFGNILDNALEACEGVPGAQIRLQAYLAKGTSSFTSATRCAVSLQRQSRGAFRSWSAAWAFAC